MTRKKFVGKMNHLYTAIILEAKANGGNLEQVKKCAKVKAKDYKLPEGKSYSEVWENLKTLRKFYGVA